MESYLENFQNIPRMSLAPLDTPIHHLAGMKKSHDSIDQLYCKRDDFIGSLVWGNKLRKLEYTLAEAKARGADTLITTGGMQSNHARTTAQAGMQMGFRVILVLNGDPPEPPVANYLISKKLGVEIHVVPERHNRIPRMKEIADQVKAQGGHPFIIPLGASDEFGTLGFVRAVSELKAQEVNLGFEFDYIFHASSSGGTQAGLLLGKKLNKLKAEIIGVSADSSVMELHEAIFNALRPIEKRISAPPLVQESIIHAEVNYIGSGYGIPTPASLQAEQEFAQNAGILLDQTYTAKTGAAILDYYKTGKLTAKDRVLFWHTGGTIALFQ